MGIRRGLVLAVTLTALAGAFVGTPALAAPPVPRPRAALPATIDRAAFYEPQALCDPTPRPGVVLLRDLLVATYGPATTYLGRACTSSTSEHFDGRALDWMRNSRVTAQKAQADAFVAWLLAPAADGTPHAMARRLGIMYVIWNSRMIRMYDPGRGWTNYRNCLAKKNSGKGHDTSCHRNHVHLSLSWDGAAGITSFWTGRAQTLPSCAAQTSKASRGAGSARVVHPEAVSGLVSVPATRLLDTSMGVGGGLVEPCRLRAGRSIHPTVAGGVVPTAAQWAAVRVASASNAPARLSVWSSGAPRPTGQVVTPIGTTTATVLVPIASDGTIALATSLGSARVAASVVGYLPGAGQPPDGTAKVATRPTVPRKVRTTSADRAVTTRWKKPRSNGGAPVSGYRVEALVSKKKGAAVVGACATRASARRCTIKGLTAGRSYWMSVSVGNEVGRTWATRVKVKVR